MLGCGPEKKQDGYLAFIIVLERLVGGATRVVSIFGALSLARELDCLSFIIKLNRTD